MAVISGRWAEKDALAGMLASDEAELVAIYGRRRVGKTFLVRNFFEKELIFEFAGTHEASLTDQLSSFRESLSSSAALQIAKPDNWSEAFQMLSQLLAKPLKKAKKVILLDEFPWIHTPKSGFLQAFDHFWNSWAVKQKNLIVVICGSAASWMIRNVFNSRGGLHNRVTKRIRLLPFTLKETEEYLKSRHINLDRYQILQIYMAMGGIPHYLKEITPGNSATQIIDRVCLTKTGFLHEEFNNLFYSLFDKADDHISIIRALAKKGSGLTRNEIIVTCRLPQGGGTTLLLDELIQSGFISSYVPFDRHAKDNIYKLTDEYSAFYIRFIETGKLEGPGSWNQFSGTASWKSWSGFAFESICMKHSDQVKKALGISGMHTETSVWRARGEQEKSGAQIDLLIDRQDRCINICEIKYSIAEYEITKSYAAQLKTKVQVFRTGTGTKKNFFLTLITTFGIKNRDNTPGLVDQSIEMAALFES